eukprot:TRINITY_DN14578_c0_g1_i13.p1 TRINITY_DN14578_c0_g1~~TRINITY_DN14578_c0_g1_i13.p1  ORF type:complete len:302 (+),score=44.80 TRINITY_DN14578_c0_g1_i13:400-1305(+)
MDAALIIYAFTLQKPNVFRPINQIFSTAMRTDTESEEVKASMIYMKMLDISCSKLPASFLYKGRPGSGSSDGILYRGVQVVYPDFKQRYAKGNEIMFYSFKSVTDKRELMENDAFCGHKGKRTIYVKRYTSMMLLILSSTSWISVNTKMTSANSCCFQLVRLQVISSTKQCSGDNSVGDPWKTADIVHLKLLPDDIVRSPDLAAAIAAAHTKPGAARSWHELGYYGGGRVRDSHYTEVECYVRSLELNPDYANAWKNLGIAGGGTVQGKRYTSSSTQTMHLRGTTSVLQVEAPCRANATRR